MTASDFPVSLPFGTNYPSPPYSNAHRHRGRDLACPNRTPIVIQGQTCGYTGATGLVIGAHLHIQEWKGDVANVRDPRNAFKPGTVQTVSNKEDQSWGKNFGILNADGWITQYCHLDEIMVQVGQRIGVSMSKNEAYTVTDGFYRWGTGSPPTPQQSEYWADRMSKNSSAVNELYEAMKLEAENGAEFIEAKVYIKK